MNRTLHGEHQWICDWVASRTGAPPWLPGAGVGYGSLVDGQLKGGVVFDGWNGASLQIHVAAEPGSGWLTRPFLFTVFDYAFNFVKCRKLIGLIGSQHRAAVRLVFKLGFVLEATLLDAHPEGDLFIFTMSKAQCRWLDGRKNGKELGTASRLRSSGTSPSRSEQGYCAV